MGSVGRPEGLKYPVRKAIRLTEEQAQNWDSKEVKKWLELKPLELLEELYKIMTTKMQKKQGINLTPGEMEKILKIEEMLEND